MREYNLTLEYDEKIRDSITLLRDFCAENNDVLGAFSGGKDSVCIKALCKIAKIENVKWNYSATTLDPPELVRFIYREHKDVRFIRPEKSFSELCAQNGYPTRTARWCCRRLKENHHPTPNGILITGIRAAESPRRAARWRPVNISNSDHFRIINPILYWSNDEVWRFIDENKLPYCSLYDAGYDRLGCVGCPMSTRRADDIEKYPHQKAKWQRGLRAWWNIGKANNSDGTSYWNSFNDFWKWYWSNDPFPENEDELSPCQLMFSE